MLSAICTLVAALLATAAAPAAAQRGGSFCANRPSCFQDGSQCCVYPSDYSDGPRCREGRVCTYPKRSNTPGTPGDEADAPYEYEYEDPGPQVCQPGTAIFRSDFRKGPALTLGEPTTISIPGCTSVTPPSDGTYSFTTASADGTDPILYVFTRQGTLLAANDDCGIACNSAETYEDYLACLARLCTSTNFLDSGIQSVELQAGTRYAVCVSGFSDCCAGDDVAITFQPAV